MRVLIAEDDIVSRRVLQSTLVKWRYEVIATQDGDEAWQVLDREDAPRLAILDWMMPGMDGLDICRRLRQRTKAPYVYILILTARDRREDTVEGLAAGADDYVTKPFDRDELRARVQVGVRMLQLQKSLADRVSELQDALARVNLLEGLLPICSYCKKIRRDEHDWQQVEDYIGERSEAQFSESICPECFKQFVTPELERMTAE